MNIVQERKQSLLPGGRDYRTPKNDASEVYRRARRDCTQKEPRVESTPRAARRLTQPYMDVH